MRRVILTLTLAVLAFPALAWAQCTGASPTWTSTPDYASASQCVAQATPGDKVILLPGSAAYTQTLLLDKAITLDGMGAVALSSSTVDIVAIDTLDPVTVRGIAFSGGPLSGAMVHVRNSGTAARITGNRFTQNTGPSTRAIIFARATVADRPECPKGLVDHNYFTNSFPFQTIFVGCDDKVAWGRESPIGTFDQVVVESNYWNFTVAANGISAIDSAYGACWTSRDNVAINTSFAAHEDNGNAAPQRSSTRCYEIYRNVFMQVGPNNLFTTLILRGGTGVVWENVFRCFTTHPAGCQHPTRLSVYRGDHQTSGAADPARACDGDYPAPLAGSFDGNFVFGAATIGTLGWNGYRAFRADGANCRVGPDGLCDTLPGNDPLVAGDAVEYRTGWPCWGQIGRGKIVAGQGPGESDPLYIWDNTCTGAYNRLTCVAGVAKADILTSQPNARARVTHVVEGRDFFYAPRPGYVPAEFPHPFVRSAP